eukprot:gene41670-51635_t
MKPKNGKAVKGGRTWNHGLMHGPGLQVMQTGTYTGTDVVRCYPHRLIQNTLSTQFNTEFDAKAHTAKDRELVDRPAHKLLQHICHKYNDLSHIDPTALESGDQQSQHSVKLTLSDTERASLEGCVVVDSQRMRS